MLYCPISGSFSPNSVPEAVLQVPSPHIGTIGTSTTRVSYILTAAFTLTPSAARAKSILENEGKVRL